MDYKILFEIIGYAGMAFVVVSFLMKGMKLLRLLNMVGGILSCIYGILTQTYPTAILNFILVCINISFPISWYIKAKKAAHNKDVADEIDKETLDV